MLTSRGKKKIQQYHADHLLRQRIPIHKRHHKQLSIHNHALINFASNDYLGLSTHANIKKSFIDGVEQYGFGSGSSAMISGYFKPQQQLEEKFAEYLKRDRAILFNSGYHANLGVIQALASRDSYVLSDKLCHASIIDGIQLSRCNHFRYRHGDVHHVQNIIARLPRVDLIITESVFSMEGSIASINQLAAITHQHQALFMVDDAHGIGVIGKFGRGICDLVDSKTIDCLVTPLGKAFGGIGAFVSGQHELMEIILQFARTYTYTTALPPAITVATLAALEVIQKESWRREKLQRIITYFIKQAAQRNIVLNATDMTPIKTILIGDNHSVLVIQEKLMERGFLVSCIRPPTVPRNTACIRISLNCYHHEKEIDQLLDLIYEYVQE
ncbi:MAG: hypothetical protein A3F42_01225 [Gammaproteobacteria bacterium RIFCSPHIGHO2_12_FULL_37_34]|nr:MAG: hypothetical protein A3F42_01225 [Gammaproteobacteria bacterium RIFCSPHIGHO2_12_FULL_37_34]